MLVTVCQLSNEPEQLEQDWQQLTAHVRDKKSELVLLPEMPFYPWMAWTKKYDPAVWDHAGQNNKNRLSRFQEHSPADVISTRPAIKDGNNLNEGYFWEQKSGYRKIHTKYYLPNEECFWEATWYNRGDCDFKPLNGAGIRIGMLICTEIWFTEHARNYAKQGIHILAAPRATEMASADKWLAGGRAAAVMSGSFCLSSNRGNIDKNGMEWAGQGWIIEPDGEILGITSIREPFITVDINLTAAEKAKTTYPRYVQE